MAGPAGASATVTAVELTLSTVTTIDADVLDGSRLAGTCKLICAADVYSRVAGVPSKVTATLLPAKFEPMTVPSEPGTRGVAIRLAALITEVTVTGGAGAGTACPGRCRSRSPCAMPTAPSAIMSACTVTVTGMVKGVESGPPPLTTRLAV